MRRALLAWLFAVIPALLMSPQPVAAQRGGHDSPGRNFHGRDSRGGNFHGGDFHGRNFQHFAPHERNLWRGGRWEHGWHDGRFAWWWIVNGGWYFYPTPIYPYPTYVPPAIVMQQAPPMPTGLPPAQFWYFCDNPKGYYPYVAACNGPWREVPATPPPPR